MDTSFGNWVKRRRRALDITQHDLAGRVGCSVSLIFKIESEERRPSRQVAELLAKYLEIPADQHELFLKVARQEKGIHGLDALPPLPTHDTATYPHPIQSNLPLPLTPFIGRSHELLTILQQLDDPACRLLTLTGPGGVGKTRLALEAAYKLRDSFDQGVNFISLVGTGSTDFIVPAIAEALGFVFSGTVDLKTQLFHFLKEKNTLLVLDNLEHLLTGIEMMDELLELAPRVKLLTTSREQLSLRSEWVFEVQGMPLPSNIEMDDLDSNSASALFIQRAKQAKVNFTLSPEDLPDIARICQLVEGMPLGLELAATWVRVMSIGEIAREIGKSLDFLTTAARDMPERHRSIRAVFDHSWNLLSDDEQHVMMKLSVFRGGFTRTAAENVADTTLPILSSLVDKSLIRRSEAGRYDLHELIRQYATSRLQMHNHEEDVNDRKHADYYLTLVQESERQLRSHLQKETLAELAPDIDNIRTAWDYAVANMEIALLRKATGAIYYLYELHQYFQEAATLYGRGAVMLRTQMGKLNANDNTARLTELEGALGDVLTHQAFFLQRMGRNREALGLHRASIALLKPLNEPYALAFAYVLYGTLCWAVGDLTEAMSNLQEGLPLSRTKTEYPWLEAVALCFLGATLHDLGKYDEAYERLSEAMGVCNAIKDPYLTLLTGTLYSRTAKGTGNLSQAQNLLRENLQIAKESRNRWGIGLGLEQLAETMQATGNHKEARRMLEESIALYREVGDPWSLSRALIAMSQLALSQSDIVKAESSAIKAFLTAKDVEYYLNALDALSLLAEIYNMQGENLWACEIASFVIGHSASPQGAKNRAGRLQAELETQLTPEQIEIAQAQKATLDSMGRKILATIN